MSTAIRAESFLPWEGVKESVIGAIRRRPW
jgi:hypothetical protein